MSVSQ